MALINCQDCGEQISEQADACPKCGRPTEKAVRDKKLDELMWPFLAALIIVFLILKYFRLL